MRGYVDVSLYLPTVLLKSYRSEWGRGLVHPNLPLSNRLEQKNELVEFLISHEIFCCVQLDNGRAEGGKGSCSADTYVGENSELVCAIDFYI